LGAGDPQHSWPGRQPGGGRGRTTTKPPAIPPSCLRPGFPLDLRCALSLTPEAVLSVPAYQSLKSYNPNRRETDPYCGCNASSQVQWLKNDIVIPSWFFSSLAGLRSRYGQAWLLPALPASGGSSVPGLVATPPQCLPAPLSHSNSPLPPLTGSPVMTPGTGIVLDSVPASRSSTSSHLPSPSGNAGHLVAGLGRPGQGLGIIIQLTTGRHWAWEGAQPGDPTGWHIQALGPLHPHSPFLEIAVVG